MLDGDLFPETRSVTAANELDERYTLREDVQWALRLVGAERFDLDVAACEESHHAERWYSREVDGLKQSWFGHVWCNPPYSDIEPWVKRSAKEVGDVDGRVLSVSMLLPATRTEQPWWQRLVEPKRDRILRQRWRLTSHFLPGRTRFGMPGNPLGIGVGSPPFACVLLVWRRT